MGNILVVGCVSLDTIHLSSGKTVSTIGGAGLYTALAASKAGANVTLFAPRPEPPPEVVTPVIPFFSWIGPSIGVEHMPSLEIAHHGNGRATLISASWGAEILLTPQAFTTYGESNFDFIHIAALSSASRQVEFVEAFRKNARHHKISVGTYAKAIQSDRRTISELLDEADLFFMNQNEANLLGVTPENHLELLGLEKHPGKTVFITNGASGVTIIEAHRQVTLPAASAKEIDPTGAGDTFCGTTLAIMSQKIDVINAARKAILQASKVVEQPGPSAFFE